MIVGVRFPVRNQVEFIEPFAPAGIKYPGQKFIVWPDRNFRVLEKAPGFPEDRSCTSRKQYA